MAARARYAFERVPDVMGDGVRLRGIGPADIPDIVEISVYDGVAATNEGEALAMLERITADMHRGEGVHWGICLPGSDEVVGTCGFHHGYPDGVAEVGYVLRGAYRGRGVMTAAVRAVVAYGLGPMGLAAVIARTEPDNHASVAVLRRAGFVEVEGADGYRVFEVRPGPATAG